MLCELRCLVNLCGCGTKEYDEKRLDQDVRASACQWEVLSRSSDGARPLIAYIAHNFETELAADIARSFRGNLLCKAALIACKKPLTNNVTSVLIGATAAKLSAVPSGRL